MYKKICLMLFIAIFAYTYAIDTRTETTCQTHKRNTKGGLMTWNITCDADGKYMPLQCTSSTPKWCACYNKEQSITQPSRGTKTCECHVAKDLAKQNSANPCDIPECHREGTFEKKQCCSTTRQCWCVDPLTGQRKTQPSSDRNIRC